MLIVGGTAPALPVMTADALLLTHLFAIISMFDVFA